MLTTRRYPEYPAQGGSKERAPALEAMADDFYTDMRDEDLYDEAHTTQAMSTYDITRMSQFSQVTTKIPPSFDGKTSWFAYEDAIDDWCDVTELDDEKRREGQHCVIDLKETPPFTRRSWIVMP